MACVSRFGLVQPPARVGPEGVSDVPVDPSEVKPFRVEMATAPALHLGVLGVERIGHDFEKGFVTGQAAHVFRRSRSGAVQTCRETRRVFEGQPLLDFNNVTPVVAEIVRVDEPHALIATEVSQRDLALIEQARAVFECHVLDVGIAITKATDAKLMKMKVPPIESRLDREVRLVETPIQRHDQSSPDRRLNFIERDAEFSRVEIWPPDGTTSNRDAR